MARHLIGPEDKLTSSANRLSVLAHMSTNRKPRKSYDPLADHFAHGRIGRTQYEAGREFKRHFEIADKRRPADFERERPGNLTADQLLAWKWLAKCYRTLGADGSALVNDVLISGKTTKQIVESRGKTGPQWESYYSRRLRECLNCLVLVFGLFLEVRTNSKTVRPSLHAEPAT